MGGKNASWIFLHSRSEQISENAAVYYFTRFSLQLLLMRLLFGFVHVGGTALVLSQLSIIHDLKGCASVWFETAVVAVQARVLLPDLQHAAPGDGWVAISLLAKPPADVVCVGAVA